MSTRILGIDVSHYQNHVDFNLLKSKGVEFAIIKSTSGDYRVDRKLKQHVQGASDAGMVVGVYHWNDPITNDESQAKYIHQAIANLPVQFVAIDVEQFWKDWAEWRQWIRGKIPKITKRFSANRISNSAKTVAGLTKEKTGLPTLIYTRKTFIFDYARPMLNWIPNYPLWLAAYHSYPAQPITLSWEEFKNNHLPSSFGPQLPAGSNRWHFWQFTGDRYILPGIEGNPGQPGPLDVNFFNGSLDDLTKFASGNIVPPPPPPPPPANTELKARVTTPVLFVRSGPGTSFSNIGQLKQGDTISVQNIGGKFVWIEIDPGKWAAYIFGNEQFMKVNKTSVPESKLLAEVMVSVLNVRSGPGTNHTDVGDLYLGNKVGIHNIDGDDVWLEFETGKWAAFAHNGGHFMEIV